MREKIQIRFFFLGNARSLGTYLYTKSLDEFIYELGLTLRQILEKQSSNQDGVEFFIYSN